MGKPPFDPNKPFEVADKPPFDPSAPFEEAQGPEQERPWYSITPQGLWEGVKSVPENIDKYTGAPIRKFLTEAVTGEKLDKAPTGKEQAMRMGMHDVSYKDQWGVPFWLGGNISPADLSGALLDIAQDPFVLASGLKKGLSAVGRIAPEIVENLGTKQGTKQLIEVAQQQSASARAEGSANSLASISGGDTTIEHSGQTFSKVAPKSLDELREWQPPAGASEMPGRQRLLQIEQEVPDLETKPLQYHYEMMENPKAMKDLKLQYENLPTADAKKIATYNNAMVEESGRKVQETIQSLAGGEPRAMTDAGNDLISTVKEKYHAEKKALAPAFEQLNKSGGRISAQESRDLLQGIASNSKVGRLIAQDPETGVFFLNKNTPKSGVSDIEHGILSRVVDDLNKGMTFKEIQNTREFLRKAIDPANPVATAELGKVRSIMLGQLEDMAARRGSSVGDTFKAYAVNERARESVEKIIGGKIENLDLMFAANPDNVVKKIFSNPNYSKIVGQYIGPQKMNEMRASYIQNGIKNAFDSANGFNPSALRIWLKSNQQFLTNNLTPEITQRLKALADYGYYGRRFLDEVNPSGTAASLLAGLEPKNLVTKISQKGILGTVSSEVSQRVGSATSQRQAARTLNESLGGTNPDVLKYLKDKFNPSMLESSKVVGAGILTRAGLEQKKIIDVAQSSDQNKAPDKQSLLEQTQGTKYNQVLQNAASRGDDAFNAANYVLMARDPDYRKTINNKNKQKLGSDQ